MEQTQIKADTTTRSEPGKFTCLCCQVKFESRDLQTSHFKSEWHQYNLKRKICKLPSIGLDAFNEIQANAVPVAQNTRSKNNQMFEEPSRSSGRSIDRTGVVHDDDDDDNDDDWIDEEELVDDDYDEEEAQEMLAKVIKIDTCLFCDKKSADIKNNVNHMNLFHGFFIPEEQYMVDLEGLIEYLGFKVGAGATCLWCSKQFGSVHGVRLHMIYKDHCKIMYDQDKAVDEFKEFYDYSTQEQIEMKPLNQLAIPKKRPAFRADYHNALVRSRPDGGRGAGQLVAKKNLAVVPGSYQAKNIKKFEAYRAKIVLRIGMANNFSMRGRLRQQNPI